MLLVERVESETLAHIRAGEEVTVAEAHDRLHELLAEPLHPTADLPVEEREWRKAMGV